jgi:hypothetical protein
MDEPIAAGSTQAVKKDDVMCNKVMTAALTRAA